MDVEIFKMKLKKVGFQTEKNWYKRNGHCRFYTSATYTLFDSAQFHQDSVVLYRQREHYVCSIGFDAVYDIVHKQEMLPAFYLIERQPFTWSNQIFKDEMDKKIPKLIKEFFQC